MALANAALPDIVEVPWNDLASANALIVFTPRRHERDVPTKRGTMDLVVRGDLFIAEGGDFAGTLYEDVRVMRTGIRLPLERVAIGTPCGGRMAWGKSKDGDPITVLNGMDDGDEPKAEAALAKHSGKAATAAPKVDAEPAATKAAKTARAVAAGDEEPPPF